MNRALCALKATYNFFSGDAVLLSAAILTFLLGYLLAQVLKAPNALVAVAFVAIVVIGLCVSLGREVAGRPRQR